MYPHKEIVLFLNLTSIYFYNVKIVIIFRIFTVNTLVQVFIKLGFLFILFAVGKNFVWMYLWRRGVGISNPLQMTLVQLEEETSHALQ